MAFHGPELCDDPDCRVCYPDTSVTKIIASAETREQRIETEVLKQAAIYRIGTDSTTLRRAAILALMERGEY